MTIEVTELIVTRGIPGSGKSWWAKNWVAQNVRHRARVERDALRAMLHDSVFKGSHTENQIKAVEVSIVATLLSTGISVVISDTNLDVATFNVWRDLAAKMPVRFTMQDFRDVDLQTCLERNALRTGVARVPEEVIISMHDKYIRGIQ